MEACWACQAELPPGARFCPGCGIRVHQVARAGEERKVVTVLFADLVGSTAQADQRDPEDVRATLVPFYQRMRAELERFGGRVEKFIGDAVMALFGAPVAHEDDPERGVRAALAIRDAIVELQQQRGLELSVRVSVATGEAVIDLQARPEQGQGMAAGDIVNTAFRVAEAAPVNGILVDESTYRATYRMIEFGASDPVQAKGKVAPLVVWQAIAPRVRFGQADLPVIHAPLIGRQEELRRLLDAFDKIRKERTPQLVTVTGDPGIGKSRLILEFASELDARPESTYWRQGRSLPYGEETPFWALAEILKAMPASSARTTRRPPSGSSGRRLVMPYPRPPRQNGSSEPCVRSSDCLAMLTVTLTAVVENLLPGVASLKGWQSAGPWCSCSRTSTGPTRACWSSSITWLPNPRLSRC